MKYAEGTTAAEGIVKSMSCEKGKPEELVLQSGDKDLDFQASGPHGVGFSDTVWYGEDHCNACRHIKGMKRWCDTSLPRIQAQKVKSSGSSCATI